MSEYSCDDKHEFYEAINNLLQIGAISECEPCTGQFISSVFLIPKPNGKKRFILNLKALNKFITTDHFKLEDLRTAIKLISPGCFMATLDLKDAYFLVKIHPESRKYLRFIFDNNMYEFHVLPFGLNTAPYLFTKLMKPVVKLLRMAGYISTIYLDDLCLIGNSFRECTENIDITIKLLKGLGFIINYEKSNLQPSTSCKFLGFIINSYKFEIKLPQEKRTRIKTELNKFIHLNRCKIRTFAQLVGLLVSACPAIEYGWLYTKEFERTKFLNLIDNDNYNKSMIIPEHLQNDIKWWLKGIDKSVHRILTDTYACEIFSDASTTGWGAACETESASGPWSMEERTQHINYLELLAAFLALKVFAKDARNCQILLRIDNSTAISYINRMGGVQYPHLTRITKDIWQWCESRRIFVSASYIKSTDNIIADAESRRNHPDIEWELNSDSFTQITNNFGMPDIDLFASRINRKCAKYVSWHRDPDAFAINAFTFNWKNFFFYAFPPVSVILKMLRKIINDGATGIVVVPMWPTQPWYPLFNKLVVSNIIIFKPHENVLISHFSRAQVQKSLTLVAAILSATRSCDETPRQPQQI